MLTNRHQATDDILTQQQPSSDGPAHAGKPVTSHPLPADYFSANRERLQDQLGEPSLAILTAGRAPHRTADESYPFWANRNCYYLSGIEQADTVLVLYRNGVNSQQILYIQQQDPMFERWRGHRFSREEAMALSGLVDIRLSEQLKEDLTGLLTCAGPALWLDKSAQDEQSAELAKWLAETQAETFAASRDLAPVLTGLRMIKCPAELDRMVQAITLTGDGIAAMLRRLRPGLMEYHLWSAFARVLADAGCLSPAFASIVASGDNVFCLHYMTPQAQIRDGDLVQIDVGAIAGSLCADISRVFPANGCFTPQQRQVYAIVRRCQETAFNTIRPGITLENINEACRETARQGLMGAGLMQAEEAITDYFWHNVSHHLGLDVHDVSDREALLQPGMVLTVEPGLYIPAIHIGMRIEDDVLVTTEGCRVLSAAIPREAEEIEALMQR